MSNSDPILVSYHDSIVRQSNLKTLNEGQWLDDNIITFAFEYFQHNSENSQLKLHVEFLSPPVVQLLKMSDDDFSTSLLESINFLSKHFLVIPLNNNNDVNVFAGTHWSLLILSVSDKIFYHFDSASLSNDRTAKEIVKKFRRFFSQDVKLINAICPQQQNSFDCGVYLISIAEEFSRFLTEKFSIEEFSSLLQRSINSRTIDERRKALKSLLESLSQKN